MNTINMYNKTHKLAIIMTLFRDMLASRYFMIIVEALTTTFISIHTSRYNGSRDWWCTLFFCIVTSVVANFICVFSANLQNKERNMIGYFNSVYDIQNRINCDTANRLYRVNKKVAEGIRQHKIEKGAIDSIADFQNLSFYVCNELHDFISTNFDCGEVEITIFQRFKDDHDKDFVKMIAYKNSKNNMPATYGEEFKLSYQKQTSPMFVMIFNDLNAEIRILENKKSVMKNFHYLHNSKVREEKICQYIGVPIRTNRKMIEVLLQIDVSKEKALGKNYNALKQFSERIVLPFCNLLHCSYERDLILSKFYDILEENISVKDKQK